MVTLPIEGRWGLRALREADRSEVLRFLDDERLMNLYLISRVHDEGLRDTQFVGVRWNGDLVAVASLASNVVVAVAPSADDVTRATILTLLADHILTRGIVVRAIISEGRLVDGLWRLLERRIDPPTVVRLRQPVYALTRLAGDLPDLSRIRYSEIGDLDQLVPACAAMHREEVGIDPMVRDAAGYRERIRDLIVRQRSLVLVERGEIVFKTEFSAVTPYAVQLMGVWTAPRHRRQGKARLALREICGHLLGRGQAVTLFVNDFNTAAIDLYESLGFVRIGENRALLW
ncbi:MAG TPA: GNAT family N-acetyltransferase [Thermoanaerobaculia bacterium]|nr:GNAT family N-acetyltransferase [Thermoanaerobaculia bacterium]